MLTRDILVGEVDETIQRSLSKPGRHTEHIRRVLPVTF
jgi:hypothetical protein